MESTKVNSSPMEKEGSYKVKLSESEKSVKAEVVVEGTDLETTMKESQELFDKAREYAKLKTLQKNI